MAQDTFGRNVRISIEQAEGTLGNDAAMPMALILNEFITNAVKYGLTRDDGEIRVGLIAANKEVELYVEDDGPGFDFQAAAQRSSGLGLVQALARQLKGQLE